jgi:hypothetical protein
LRDPDPDRGPDPVFAHPPSKLDARCTDRSVEGVRSFRVFLSVTFATAGVVAFACSTKAPLVAAGGDCQLATDCDDGLICVPQKANSNGCPCYCTGDAGSVQQLPPAADAGKVAAQDAAPVTDSAPPPPVPDASAGD